MRSESEAAARRPEHEMGGTLRERLEEEMTRRGFFGLGVGSIAALLLVATGCGGGGDDDDGGEEEGGEED